MISLSSHHIARPKPRSASSLGSIQPSTQTKPLDHRPPPFSDDFDGSIARHGVFFGGSSPTSNPPSKSLYDSLFCSRPYGFPMNNCTRNQLQTLESAIHQTGTRCTKWSQRVAENGLRLCETTNEMQGRDLFDLWCVFSYSAISDCSFSSSPRFSPLVALQLPRSCPPPSGHRFCVAGWGGDVRIIVLLVAAGLRSAFASGCWGGDAVHNLPANMSSIGGRRRDQHASVAGIHGVSNGRARPLGAAWRRERAASVSRTRLPAPTYTPFSYACVYATHRHPHVRCVCRPRVHGRAVYEGVAEHRAAVPARADVAAFVASTPYTLETPRVRPELRVCGAYSAPALVTGHVSTVDRIPHECAASRLTLDWVAHPDVVRNVRAEQRFVTSCTLPIWSTMLIFFKTSGVCFVLAVADDVKST
ncbi:hypothetical protein C8F04DRAFT_1255904 [Mycena alexandri]|uniref:Uncharacterized protein n=1 Tax=Mycena alexandri TaxID=1745969 RepID=A0AAD6XAY9_9AGAR|nr:hypothetical protein C8F04DRAFT_1255904 [Mycena alexandri]